MNGSLKRLISFLAAAAMLVCLALLPPAARAAASPEFSISIDNQTPKTGDIVTVSFSVAGADTEAITAFNGRITFNNNFFRYSRYVIPAAMKDKVFCYDDKDITTSAVGFSFADASGTKLPGGAGETVFFQVEFVAVNTRANSVNFQGVISSCTVGSEKDVTVPPLSPLSVTVMTTAPTSTTTTTSTTSTTTTTTTTRTAAVLSSDCDLRELTVAPGTLSPAFSNGVVAYNVTVDNEISNIRISATPNSDYALVNGTGVKDLIVGLNSFTVTVTAQDGTRRSYGINVYRAEPSEQVQEEEIPIIEDTTTTTPLFTTTASTYPPYLITTTPTQSGGSSDDSAIKVIGIVFGLIALFFFGFLSGFFIDKSIKKKKEEETAAANAAMYQQPYPQMPMQMPVVPPMPQQMPMMSDMQQMPDLTADPTVRDDFVTYDQNGFPVYNEFPGGSYEPYGEDDYYN